MKTKELIEILSGLNPDAEIELAVSHWEKSSFDDYTGFEVTETRLLMSIGEYVWQKRKRILLSGDIVPFSEDPPTKGKIKRVYP